MVAPHFENFLLQLAKSLKFSTLTPDSNGACLILMKEEHLALLFEFDDQLVPNTILLSCELASFSPQNKKEICEVILLGNSSMEESLSIKPDEDKVYLHRRFHPNISYSDLEPLFTQFINQGLNWRNKINEIEKRVAPSTPPSSIQLFPYKG